MNLLILSIFIGALAGLGLCLLAAVFVPNAPDISDTIARLYSPEAARRARLAATPVEQTRTEVFGSWVQRHARWLPMTVSYEDLEALDVSAAQLYANKALLALVGASTSVLMGTVQALMGAPAVTLPGAVGILLAIGGWMLPDLMARQGAAAKRENLTRTVTAYYDLVTLMRLSGATVSDSITVPAQIADAPLFVRIRGTLTRQQLTHKAPWDGLLELAGDINLPELRELGDLMALSGDRGTPASTILRAKARDIRSDRLGRDIELAQRDLQRSMIYQVLLLATIICFLVTPSVLRLIG